LDILDESEESWKNSFGRDRDGRNTPSENRMVTLFIVEERVGEVEDVFMAVDVRHSNDGSMEKGY